MKKYVPITAIVLAMFMVGCSIRVSSPPGRIKSQPAYTGEANFDFPARIEAAKAIHSFISRDSALSTIAIHAAGEGDIDHTLKALSLITSFTTRDSTSEKCVAPFLTRNMVEEALKVANKMESFTRRDRVLSRIAQAPLARVVE